MSRSEALNFVESFDRGGVIEEERQCVIDYLRYVKRRSDDDDIKELIDSMMSDIDDELHRTTEYRQ